MNNNERLFENYCHKRKSVTMENKGIKVTENEARPPTITKKISGKVYLIKISFNEIFRLSILALILPPNNQVISAVQNLKKSKTIIIS